MPTIDTRTKNRAARGQQTPAIQSLDRGLVILEAVAKSTEPVSLDELASLLQVDRSSVFRLANTLKRRGFLGYPAGRKDYILGPAIWRLSREYDWSNMLIKISHDYLKVLVSRTNETAHLAVREGRHALLIDHVSTNHLVGVSGQTGELVPLYCTAHGKALLADFGRTELESLFGPAPLRKHTSSTITALDDLAEMCSQIKSQGFAVDDGEFIEGVRCVASPIRAQDGMIIGSLGISAPSQRFSEERHPEWSAQVSDIARQIHGALSTSAQEA